MKDNYDKNDRFAELLGDKLRGHMEEPPADMFDRIERTLAAAAPVKREPAVVVPLWRRVWSRGVAVAMAAAVVAVAFVVTMRRSAPEEIAAMGEQMAVVAEMQQAEGQQEVAPEVVQVAEAVAMKAAPRVNSPKLNVEVVAPVATLPEAEELAVVAPKEKEEGEAEVAKQSNRRERKKGATTTRRTTRRRDTAELEAYWREAMWDDSRFEAPEQRVTLALHATGTGMGNMEMTHRTGSNLLVNEQSNIASGGYLGAPQMVGKSPAAPKLEHFMPITVGITVNFSITDYLSVESGLLYTSLSSKGENKGSLSLYESWRKMNYLGVPLSLLLNVVDYGPLALYARLGATMEFNVDATDKVLLDGELMQTTNLEVPFVTLSMDGAVGVNYNFAENLSLFGELGGSYWFAGVDYPENYRTVKPLTLSSRVGLRIAFN